MKRLQFPLISEPFNCDCHPQKPAQNPKLLDIKFHKQQLVSFIDAQNIPVILIRLEMTGKGRVVFFIFLFQEDK